ncbi:MAG: helix-turn-helix domain-containing protein [Bdellovibrionales bacterium]
MDDLAKRLGKRITTVRKKRGMTSEKLAYENDVSKGYLSDIESGKRLPSLRMLAKLAEALSVDIKDLF